eukprot:9125141-Karenia_brevis.AAC.1
MMGNQISVALMKTLLGAWITSRRVQASVRHCIFCSSPSGDCLQHYCCCDKLWHAIHCAFPPFVAAFDPLLLFGLSPPDPYQIYGIFLAYHTYHTLRSNDHNSLQACISTAKAYMRGCKVNTHLIKAFFGKSRLRYSPSSPSSPTPASGGSSHTAMHRSSSAPPNAEISENARTPHDRAMYRMNMPCNRQAVLRARGLDVGAVPFQARH